ncbi:uncharacterized protein LOC119112713 [Pollicipes pollicipes]|uniref:uncharacterized protein LOC119112713 n=1 Tax=Pollicipes pollicipes TaxID=41117 RepID=UPI001884E47A|nr:uncharacterized protein LOC119112713 [Pollicipes pollicipes]
MLLGFVLATFLHVSKACLEVPHYFGSMDASLEISRSTLRETGSSCHCCGLCHQDDRCKSFTFDVNENSCVLYSKVGGYSEFTRLPSSQSTQEYFFMPNSSTTGEFCRHDTDCQAGSGSCIARICTTDVTRTCRDVYEIKVESPDHAYWGAVKGEEILFYCVMNYRKGGYTMLLEAPFWFTRWTTSNRLNFIYTESGNIPGGGDPVSHLWAGDAIRDSRPGDYHVVVVSAIGPADGVEFAVSRSQSVVMSLGMPVAYETTDGSFSFSGGGTVMYPYLTNTNGILYHMNSIVTSQAGGLIRSRTTTDPRWSQDVQRPGSVRLLLREGD